jgi:hypothetical protein
MKSAYELAMERLNKQAPSKALTAEQKARLAELESIYKAKIAEQELRFGDDIAAAQGAGDVEKTEKLRQQFAEEKRKLEAEREAKKEKVRGG